MAVSITFNHFIFSTHNIDEVIESLSKATEVDLVVVDVDEVLITPTDLILRPSASKMCTMLSDPFLFNEANELDERKWSTWISQHRMEIVNPKLIATLQQLQAKKIKCIALTRLYPGTGRCGIIESMEDWRFEMLKSFGIDFRTSFESIERLEMDFEPKLGRIPLFKEGILYSRPYTKGEVLVKFLDKVGFTPKKVWFVDNDASQVNIVGESIFKMGCPYEGIHYLDQRLVGETYYEHAGKFQMTYFDVTDIWLPDDTDEVVRLIQKESSKI